MKAVFYFSAKQESVLKTYKIPINKIDGVKFTEVKSFQDNEDYPTKNGWDDSVVVAVYENLDDGEFQPGKFCAITKNLNITYG